MAEGVSDHLVEKTKDEEDKQNETGDMTENTTVPLSDNANSQLASKLEELLLDESHKIVLTIPLESYHSNRSRHLVIVSAPPNKTTGATRLENEEPPGISRMCSAYGKMTRNCRTMDLDYCLLGVDIFMQDEKEVISLGFVLKILWGTETSLDGDGGFGVHILNMHYTFKPVSLQFLWTTIQTLYAISARLRPKRYSICVLEEDWVKGYEEIISSPQSCINEWNEMTDILSRRPLSPDDISVLSSDAASAETMKTIIKSKLREIMKTVDLDDITSKTIRLRLETELEQKLDDFKSFIDEEILLILGQMDPASEIFDFMFLGSEWNASNLEELNSNGITHILNVTREIDNFFPAVFKYMNIREYDVEETDLLKYWDKTYNFVADCIYMGGKVLVHCKMGISRSASTVCAFAMKHFGWSLETALKHTKKCRSIINPNKGFRHQLSVYEGILQASRQRLSFRQKHRSKSDIPIKRNDNFANKNQTSEKMPGLVSLLSDPSLNASSGENIKVSLSKRPASWSPTTNTASLLFDEQDDPSPSPSPLVCHCYSQLSAHFSDPQTTACPTPISGPLARGQRAKRVYSLPGQEDPPIDADEEDVVDEVVHNERVCPAQSHLSQCTCNLELELSASDISGSGSNSI